MWLLVSRVTVRVRLMWCVDNRGCSLLFPLHIKAPQAPAYIPVEAVLTTLNGLLVTVQVSLCCGSLSSSSSSTLLPFLFLFVATLDSRLFLGKQTQES
jgi:hypothetical protein